MALQENHLTYTYIADVALAEYLLVAPSTVNERGVKLPAAAGDLAIGAIRFGADAGGKGVTVANSGIVIVKAGGAVPIGSPIMADTAGKAVVATTGKLAIGFSLQLGANNDLIEAHLTGPFRIP